MAVQSPVVNSTTIAGLLNIVANNAAQQIADETAIANLQTQFSNVSSALYQPPGAYTPPSASGGQTYATQTSWAVARSQGALMYGPTTGSYGNQPSFNQQYCDVWDAANKVALAIGYTSNANYIYVYRIQYGATGAPTLLGSVGTNTGGQSYLLGVAILSAKLARVTIYYSGAPNVQEWYISWNGTTLTSTQAAATSYAGYNATLASNVAPNAVINLRGFLTGSASWVHLFNTITANTGFGYEQTSGWYQKDRNATNTFQPCLASPCQSGASMTSSTPCPTTADQIGNGYFLRGGSSTIVSDPVARPAIYLEYIDDGVSKRIQTLRLPGISFAGWSNISVISPSLAIFQCFDTSGNYYVGAVSINLTASTPLGLYGPYSISGAGSVRWLENNMLLFDATDAYVPYSMAASSPMTLKLAKISFNSANNPAVATSSANDLTLTLTGNGTSSYTNCFLRTIVQLSSDQVGVVYTANTGGYSYQFFEVFNLASS